MRKRSADRRAFDPGGRRLERVLRAMTPPSAWKEARRTMRKALRGHV